MIDVTDLNFQAQVIEASRSALVVVDLWAPWCGPCRQLGPILEEVVQARHPKVILAKVNVDENPQISARFSVQSIPAVYALSNEKVVDGFVGAKSKSAVEQFIDALLPTEADLLVDKGDEVSLRQALALDPDHVRAIECLATILVDRGDLDEAESLMGRVAETQVTRKLAARCRLVRDQIVSGQSNPSERNPKNAQVPGEEDLENQLKDLLDLIPQDPEAKRRYLDILATLDDSSPLVPRYRKELASKIF